MLAAYDLAEELHRIPHETLVTTGEFDQGSNTRMARLMAARIPKSQLSIVPQLKPALLLEAPDTLAGPIRGFIITATVPAQRSIVKRSVYSLAPSLTAGGAEESRLPV